MYVRIVFSVLIITTLQFICWAQNADTTSYQVSEQSNFLLNNLVINKGQIEVIDFTILETKQTTTADIGSLDTTFTYGQLHSLTNYLQLNYGLTRTPMLNFGVDILYSINSIILKSDGTNPSQSEGTATINGLQAIGPRVRWLPAKSIPELSMQSSFLVPAADSAKRQALGFDRSLLVNQFFFYQTFLRMTLQVQADVGIYFKNESRRQTTYMFTGYAYLFYPLLNRELSLLGSVQYNTNQYKSIKGGLREESHRWVGSIGLFWQFGERGWSINSTFSLPFSYQLPSLTTTVDQRSWWIISLGVRYTHAFKVK